MRYLTVVLIVSCVLSFATSSYSADNSQVVQTAQNIKAGRSGSVTNYSYKIVKTFPHDEKAFTEGLVFDEGTLYEGTGIKGYSSLRSINLNTGEVLRSLKLQDRYFGEGITIFGDRLLQLTWRSKTGFVYDKKFFVLIRTFHYSSEGWGLTHDDTNLIMSNGTASLIYLYPETFAEVRRIKVFDDKGPIKGLNELEYVRGQIYANVWPTNRIAIISPLTGRVTGWINLEGLSRISGGDNINKTLNGIAYDKDNDRLFVTGKLWPKIYEIKLVPLNP